jgi:mRNA-degrading endonuclease RelE of RelBE toxin-antitoxin system
MKSFTTERFMKLYRDLPEQSRKQAREAYKQFIDNPQHPSLHFKQVHAGKSIYSARINKNYRVLGILNGSEIVWFWIGIHDEYDKLLARL